MPKNQRTTSLVHRKKRATARKKKSMKKKEVWFVGKNQNGKLFYVVDFDDEHQLIYWETNRDEAIAFKSDEGANDFIQQYMGGRTDVMLINS